MQKKLEGHKLYIAEAYEIWEQVQEGKKSYKEAYTKDYLNSNHWRQMKVDCSNDRPKACAICETRSNLHLHHLAYHSWHDVTQDDLIWLCDKHHTMAHEGINLIPREKRYKGRSIALACRTFQYIYAQEIKRAKQRIEPEPIIEERTEVVYRDKIVSRGVSLRILGLSSILCLFCGLGIGMLTTNKLNEEEVPKPQQNSSLHQFEF